VPTCRCIRRKRRSQPACSCRRSQSRPNG
jgi:hypothetical protein